MLLLFHIKPHGPKSLRSNGMLFTVRTPADFTAVERYVATLLSSDEARCSFLRSEPFTRVRMHAVYRPDDPITPSPCWGPDGLCVEIKDRVVSVELKAPPQESYDSSWGGPVVYEVLPGFQGGFDALSNAQGPFERGETVLGKRQRFHAVHDASDMV
jgi:hypothetical protein